MSPRRRRTGPEAPTSKTECFNCKRQDLTVEDVYCPDCGYPKGKREGERKAFLVEQRKKRTEYEGLDLNIRRAQNFLYFLGVVKLAFVFQPGIASTIINSSIGASFLVLAFFCRKRPFVLLLTALIVYVSLSAISFIMVPMSMVMLLVFKIVVVVALLLGMNSAKKKEKLQKELELAKAI